MTILIAYIYLVNSIDPLAFLAFVSIGYTNKDFRSKGLIIQL